MEAQFKDIKFKSENDLNEWLSKNTYAAIYLTDKGQDMQKIYMHKSGEILHTDFNASVYTGEFINPKTLKLDKPLEIFDEKKQRFIEYGRLIPEEIIY